MLYEDNSALRVLLRMLRADDARLPPAAQQMLQPPVKPRRAVEATPAAAPLPDSEGAAADDAEVRADSRLQITNRVCGLAKSRIRQDVAEASCRKTLQASV